MSDTNNRTHAIAQDIAYVQGWHYPTPQDGWTAQIKNPDTKGELWIHVEDGRLPQDGRVVISAGIGFYRDYAPYDSRDKHRITCSIAKTPPQICNDIRRRIFPGYFRDLQIAKERYPAHVERLKGIAAAALKFAAILNMPAPESATKKKPGFTWAMLPSCGVTCNLIQRAWISN